MGELGFGHAEGTPYSKIRAATARRLTLSVTTKPQVTLHSAAKLDALLLAQAELASLLPVRPTLTHLLARLTAHALVADSALNGWVRDEVIELAPTANLGIAVQTERGLVTPVVADANLLPFAEFVNRVDDLIDKARTGRLHPRELAGATFTFSNLGSSRIRHFTPIVNPPQLAILGVGRAEAVPTWQDSAWRCSTELPLSLTFDHAAIDGQPAAAFLDHLIALMETPPGDIWGSVSGEASHD